MRAYLLGAGPRQLHRLVRRDYQRHWATIERHIVQHAHHWHVPGHSHQITIWLSGKLCDKSDKPEPPRTELRLLVIGHLHEGGVALIIQDLDALDVAIDTKQREQRVRRDFLATAAPELDQTQQATVSRPFGPSDRPSFQAHLLVQPARQNDGASAGHVRVHWAAVRPGHGGVRPRHQRRAHRRRQQARSACIRALTGGV